MKHVQGLPLPPPAIAFEVARANFLESLEGLTSKEYIAQLDEFDSRYFVQGKTFGHFPRRPAVCRWVNGWAVKELAVPGE